MTRGVKTSWKGVRVLRGAEGELLATDRLAALYRFQNGDASAGHHFVDAHRETELGSPTQVDWANFPVIAALEAVTCDELRRLRMLLSDVSAEGSYAGRAVSVPSASPASSPPSDF